MKTPSFWYQSPGIYSFLLSPLAWIYEKGGRFVRRIKKSERVPIPIISVGNVVCGGAGKTPTALALIQLFKQKGINVHFVSRGYKGRIKGPHKVHTENDSYLDVGDEPLLLAQQAPTWVAKKRREGVLKSMEEGAEIVILDDGHQTTDLYKDISFVVVDERQKFGNAHVMPAGPLRENLEEGLKRADAVITIGKGDLATTKPMFTAQIVPKPLSLPTKRVIAFCGLGYPDKFYSTLKDYGLTITETVSFPDHYRYKNGDLLSLEKKALSMDAVLVTTRKDFVRLPLSWQNRVFALDIKIQFEDEQKLYEFMSKSIPSLKESL